MTTGHQLKNMELTNNKQGESIMGCIYSNFEDGTCQLFDEETDNCELGCNDDGTCYVEDDPNPDCCHFTDDSKEIDGL